MELENLDQLRAVAEKIRESGQNGICLIASIIDDKVQLACAVTDDLKEKYPAGKLVGEAAKILGGGGGGKPHLATAGGKDISKLDELLNTGFESIIKNF
jgi:alanyl-tRNA synthetase